MVGQSASSVMDDEVGQQVAQATPRVDKTDREGPPATLPRIEPLSRESWV